MKDSFFFDGVDGAVIRQERDKARKLRKSQWWKTKLSRGECHYCGGIFPAKDLTMDHLLPVSRGGSSSKGNIVACCKECNTRKRDMLPTEWEDFLSEREKNKI
jgi:5-methylcytosine-specific restriction endonuclease McrA